MAKIRTEVFIETNEKITIKRKRFFVRTWCEDCGHLVSMIPPSEAALLICQDTQTIYSLINSNQLHYRYLKTEIPFVCLKSLCAI